MLNLFFNCPKLSPQLIEMDFVSSIIIANLNKGSASTVKSEIYKLFEIYRDYDFSRKILDIRPALNPENEDECIGYAIIDFENHRYAKDALNKMIDLKLAGNRRKLICRWNTSKSRPSQIEEYNIFIDQISKSLSEEDLSRFFKNYYPYVTSIKILPYYSDLNCSYGFLKIDSKVSITQALFILNEIAKINLPGTKFYEIPCNYQNNQNDEKNNKSLFVNNLNIGITSSIIEKHFLRFGPISSIILHPEKNFCFVHYQKRIHAIAALTMMDGKKIFHQKVSCIWAYHKGVFEEEEIFYDYKIDEQNDTQDRRLDLIPRNNKKFRLFTQSDSVEISKTQYKSCSLNLATDVDETFWLSLYAKDPKVTAKDLLIT